MNKLLFHKSLILVNKGKSFVDHYYIFKSFLISRLFNLFNNQLNGIFLLKCNRSISLLIINLFSMLFRRRFYFTFIWGWCCSWDIWSKCFCLCNNIWASRFFYSGGFWFILPPKMRDGIEIKVGFKFLINF